MNLTLEQNVPVELSAVLKRLLQLSTPQALQFPKCPLNPLLMKLRQKKTKPALRGSRPPS